MLTMLFHTYFFKTHHQQFPKKNRAPGHFFGVLWWFAVFFPFFWFVLNFYKRPVFFGRIFSVPVIAPWGWIAKSRGAFLIPSGPDNGFTFKNPSRSPFLLRGLWEVRCSTRWEPQGTRSWYFWRNGLDAPHQLQTIWMVTSFQEISPLQPKFAYL